MNARKILGSSLTLFLSVLLTIGQSPVFAIGYAALIDPMNNKEDNSRSTIGGAEHAPETQSVNSADDIKAHLNKTSGDNKTQNSNSPTDSQQTTVKETNQNQNFKDALNNAPGSDNVTPNTPVTVNFQDNQPAGSNSVKLDADATINDLPGGSDVADDALKTMGNLSADATVLADLETPINVEGNATVSAQVTKDTAGKTEVTFTVANLSGTKPTEMKVDVSQNTYSNPFGAIKNALLMRNKGFGFIGKTKERGLNATGGTRFSNLTPRARTQVINQVKGQLAGGIYSPQLQAKLDHLVKLDNKLTQNPGATISTSEDRRISFRATTSLNESGAAVVSLSRVKVKEAIDVKTYVRNNATGKWQAGNNTGSPAANNRGGFVPSARVPGTNNGGNNATTNNTGGNVATTPTPGVVRGAINTISSGVNNVINTVRSLWSGSQTTSAPAPAANTNTTGGANIPMVNIPTTEITGPSLGTAAQNAYRSGTPQDKTKLLSGLGISPQGSIKINLESRTGIETYNFTMKGEISQIPKNSQVGTQLLSSGLADRITPGQEQYLRIRINKSGEIGVLSLGEHKAAQWQINNLTAKTGR